MPNQLKFKATANNTSKILEFKNPIDNTWHDGVLVNGTTSDYTLTLSNIPAGNYTNLVARLKGSNPPIISSFADIVTVINAVSNGKPTMLVTMGNSQTYGYQSVGNASNTTPKGASNTSWPDQVLSSNTTGLVVHNEGVSGETWLDLQARAQSIINYFTTTNANDYSVRIVTLQEVTNTAWKSLKNGLQSSQEAKQLVNILRAGLPADVKIWLFTGYPFNDGGNNIQVINNYIDQFNAIALNTDTTNSSTVGLYDSVDKVLNIRTLSSFADSNACLDTSIWADGIHLTADGNVRIADLVIKALNSLDKVVNSTYVESPPPYGTPYLGTPTYIPYSSFAPDATYNSTREIAYKSSGDTPAIINFTKGIRIKYPVATVNNKAPNAEFDGQFNFYIKNGTEPERLVSSYNVVSGTTPETTILFEDHPNGGSSTCRIEVVSGIFIFNNYTIESYI